MTSELRLKTLQRSYLAIQSLREELKKLQREQRERTKAMKRLRVVIENSLDEFARTLP